MRKKHVSLVAGLALCAALVAVLVGALGGPLPAGAAVLPLASTVAPSATPQPAVAVSATLSGDPARDLTTATVTLQAGFIMDPYLLPVIGKSERAASEVQKGCNGFISATPNVVVNWAGSTDQLGFFVYSDADAVLAVQQPDGSFLCNDDAGLRTTDPLVKIVDPAPGVYKVYAGTATKDAPALGFLAVTQTDLDDARLADLDLTSVLRRRERPKLLALPQLDPQTLLTGRRAIFGSTELQAGFKPVQVFAAGGGDIAAFRMEDGKLACAGFISPVPSYSFTWTGQSQGLRLFFEALKDSALAVVTPEQKVLCGMNAASANLNPVVDVPAPVAGRYQVYVASMAPDTVVGGRLTITGDLKANPAALAAPPAGAAIGGKP